MTLMVLNWPLNTKPNQRVEWPEVTPLNSTLTKPEQTNKEELHQKYHLGMDENKTVAVLEPGFTSALYIYIATDKALFSSEKC